MAEGRMLKKKISIDGVVADLENPWHIILFTWGIAHLDIEGRITGDPREYKALVAPTLDKITKIVVLDFFRKGQELGLIQRYNPSGKYVVQFCGFTKNQSLRPDKESPSQYPPPSNNLGTTPGPLPEDSGTTPAEVKISKVKLREDKLIKKHPIPPDFSISESVRKWAEGKFDRLDEHLEAFTDYVKAHGKEYIDWDSAFKKAIREDWGKIRTTIQGKPKDEQPQWARELREAKRGQHDI